jgi:histidinol-phosphate aminotransferase
VESGQEIVVAAFRIEARELSLNEIGDALAVPIDRIGDDCEVGGDGGKVDRSHDFRLGHALTSLCPNITVPVQLPCGLCRKLRELGRLGSVAFRVVTRVPVRADLSLMEGYHSPQVDVDVRLNTNEAPVGPPDAFVADYLESVSKISWNRYPDRSARELRASIAALHDVSPEMVFPANGSNEVLQTLLLTFAGPGRKVLTFEPTYQLHGHIARISGAEVVEGERCRDFTIDEDAMQSLLKEQSPHITFLCSPNNPTGTVDAPSTVRAALASSTGLVAVDEAYGQFAPWSALDLVDEETPLVVVRTFSKTWSMAAARLGYLIGPRWLVAELDKVVLPYHLDAAKQIAGVIAVRYRNEMDARVADLISERTRLSAGLRRLDVDVFDSGANFVLFRPRAMQGRRVWQGLLDRRVLVRDCSSWPRLENCLRVTIGTEQENDIFLERLTEVLS